MGPVACQNLEEAEETVHCIKEQFCEALVEGASPRASLYGSTILLTGSQRRGLRSPAFFESVAGADAHLQAEAQLRGQALGDAASIPTAACRAQGTAAFFMFFLARPASPSNATSPWSFHLPWGKCLPSKCSAERGRHRLISA